MVAADTEDCEMSNGNGHQYGSVMECTGRLPGNANEAERAPLVPKNDADYQSTATPDKASLTKRELLLDEVSGMTKLAVPVILTYLLEMLPGVITIVLVGRVGSEVEAMEGEVGTSMHKLHLDAAAMAVIFTNIVAMSPAIGIMTAMDTLCSQAHGASQPAKMGTYSLTAAVVVAVLFGISFVIMWNASYVLIALGQPVEVSKLASDFIRYTLPGIPFYFMYELIRKVFQARNEAMPMLMAAFVCIGVNLFLGYYLVRWTRLGWMGAAVAKSVGNITSVPAVLLGMKIDLGRSNSGNDCHEEFRTINDEWGTQNYLETGVKRRNQSSEDEAGGDPEFLNHLWEGFVVKKALSSKAIIEFLSLGVPGMLQLMFEWIAFEAIALLCGILPGQEAIIGIGANAIIMNVSSLTYMVYLGVSVSGSVRVGNALGAGDARRAKVASNLTIASCALMAILNMVFLVTSSGNLPWLFTTDPDIVRKAKHLFLIAAAYQLPDAVNSANQEIFRGSGRQTLGAIWNFVAFYVIGIPCGYLIGIKLGFGVEGLWLGMTIGLYAISIGLLILVLRSNWGRLARDATYRLSK